MHEGNSTACDRRRGARRRDRNRNAVAEPFNSTMPTNDPNPDPTIPAGLQYYKTAYGYGADTPQGGTSQSSPLFCSMVIQIDQVQGSRNGWLNPRLYQIQQSQGYGYALTDIIAGSNVGFRATPGYDNVTGIGSLRGFELASEL